jgi:predicted adenylyl cyclase CyaB
MPQNLEIKARITSRQQAQAHAERLGATFSGEIHQVDTYFTVTDGRLKLREFGENRGELIFYRRCEQNLQRWSTYLIYPTTDARRLLTVLAGALGVKTVVEKSRFVYLWKNARIHLDQVEGLGEFLEFEVVVVDGKQQAEELMQELRRHFEVDDQSLVRCSYADLLKGS